MKRRLRILSAYFRRWCYLLARGMWRGEFGVQMTEHGTGRVYLIAAAKSEGRWAWTSTRVFYCENA